MGHQLRRPTPRSSPDHVSSLGWGGCRGLRGGHVVTESRIGSRARGPGVSVGGVNDPAGDVDPTVRGVLTRFLIGAGVELGPGHHPIPMLFPDTSVRYADRWG